MLSHHSTSIYLVKKFFICLEFISFKLLQKFTIIFRVAVTFAITEFHCQVSFVSIEIQSFWTYALNVSIVIVFNLIIYFIGPKQFLN